MQKAIITSQYIDLEDGFYGLTDSEGNKYIAIGLPEQLKDPSIQFIITFEALDAFGFQMWGQPIRITSFTTG